MGLPPEPREPPIVQTLRWLSRPLPFLDSCRRRYGDAFSLKFLGFQTPMVMVSDPGVIRALYTTGKHGLPPGRTITLQPVMGARSLLLLEGREHLARRKLMLPPFHGERMRAYEEVVRDATAQELATWRAGEPFPIHPRMQAITLEVILRAVFGVTDEGRREALRRELPVFLAQTASARLQLRVLLSRRVGRGDPLQALRASMRGVDAILHAEIAERRADPDVDERQDILSMLVAARFEDGTRVDDEELRDQLITLLLAGHETTATALAWTFDLLVRHPQALERLRAEVDAADGDAYLRAVCTEALRLRPVVPLAGRRLASDLQAGEHLLPAGTDVSPAIWLTHTREDLYPQPHAFRPERFLPDGPDTYAWIPFGGGVRRCIGAAFAEFEMRVVLRTVLERFDVRGATDAPEPVARRNVTLSPRNGTPVVVSAR